MSKKKTKVVDPTAVNEAMLKEFIHVLDKVGIDISAYDYDHLQITHPVRRTLERHLGCGWNELKARANPQTTDSTYQALITQNKTLVKQLDKQRDLTDAFINNCLVSMSKIRFAAAKVPKKEKAKERLEAHSLRSDAHIGEYVDAKWVQGVSHYDAETYQKRLDTWTAKMILFREQDKGSLGLNKLVINYLGDIVTGENIYKGHSFSIDLHLVDQLFFGLEAETNAILALAEVYPEIEIFAVLGNHGRPGRMGENSKKTNFDYILYRCLKKALEHQKNVKVFVSESPSMITQHGQFVFLLNHGDAAKSWMGIPYYGLERLYRRLPGLYNMLIHYELIAHHHQPASIADKVYLNGSMVGGSDLSINRMGLTNLPSQKLFYFHPKKGINRESNLYLSKPVVLEADVDGIYTHHV